MPKYEYKVIPAPKKPGKIKGVKGVENKFAVELSNLMNDYGADGWEYQRTDTLPCEERQGFTGRTTTFQNMLVFRREIKEVAQEKPPVLAIEKAPEPVAEPTPAPIPTPAAAPTPVVPAVAASAVASHHEPPRDPFVEPTLEPAVEPTLEPTVEPALEPQPAAVPTFRSATIHATPDSPRLSVSSEPPEGNAPAIRFRPSDNIAAQ